MFTFLRTRPLFSLFVIALLLAVNAAAYYYVLNPPPQALRISFLDVGQGDSIYIEGPSGMELLVDGGRDRSVLRQLPAAMGLLDRDIDMVVATHPDADHIGGLSEVLERYQVRYFMEPGIDNDTSPTLRLERDVEAEQGLVRFTARKGQRIHLGEGAYADVLYPDHDVRTSETNAGSVVLRVVYGDTAFLLSGDLPVAGEEHVAALYGAELHSDVLKAGHHGSRTSSAAAWLAAADPGIVVISAGKDNSYGHPHEEALERIRESGADTISTAEQGTITFISDGTTVTRK